MSDVKLGLPVRSEADADERVQVKIVDALVPTRQMQVDADLAAKVLMTGRDAAAANRVVKTSTTGQVHVIVDSTDADETAVNDFNKGSAIAAGASSTHTYLVPALKTLSLNQVIASASARCKVEIKVGVVAAETTRAVLFGTSASPNVVFDFAEPIIATTGQNVLVIRTNTDNQPQDVYSTVIGSLI